MLLEFDAQGLQKAVNAFHDAMGVSISILYEDYSVLGSKKLNNPYCRLIQSNKKGLTRCMDQNCNLLEKCKKSKKAEMHICHAGLVEYYLNGRLVSTATVEATTDTMSYVRVFIGQYGNQYVYFDNMYFDVVDTTNQ